MNRRRRRVARCSMIPRSGCARPWRRCSSPLNSVGNDIMSKRIAFVGAGAIGGYIGGNLTALGHDVTLIDAWPAHVEAMRAKGLHLYGMTDAENHVVRVNAMHITDAQALAK